MLPTTEGGDVSASREQRWRKCSDCATKGGVIARLSTALCLALLLGLVPAQAQGSWTVPAPFEAGDESIRRGSIVYTSRGELVAIWRTGERFDAEMRAAARAPDGTFGPGSTIAEEGYGGPIAVDGQGGAFVVWGRDGYEVFASYRPPEGTFEPPEKVADGHIGVAVDANAAGDAVMTFNRYEYWEGHRQLFTSFRPAGGTWGPPEAVSGLIPDVLNDWESDVTLTPEGRAIFLWAQSVSEGGKSVMKSASRLRGGDVESESILSAAGSHSTNPEVAADGAGNAVGTWIESPKPLSYGTVVSAIRPAGGGFGAGRPAGGLSDFFFGPDLAVSDAGEFVISYNNLQATEEWPLNHAEAVLGSTVSGVISAPVPLTRSVTSEMGMAMNAQGHTIVWSWHPDRGLEVAQRAPGGAFGGSEPVACGPDFPPGYAGAVSPEGDGVVIAARYDEPALISEDLDVESSEPIECAQTPNPEPLSRARVAVRRGVGLRVRVARRGRVTRSGSLELIATCRHECRVRAGGSVELGTRALLRFTPKRALLARRASKRVRVTLTPRRARFLTRALRRGVQGRATIRLRATGTAGQRQTLVLRNVRVRR